MLVLCAQAWVLVNSFDEDYQGILSVGDVISLSRAANDQQVVLSWSEVRVWGSTNVFDARWHHMAFSVNETPEAALTIADSEFLTIKRARRQGPLTSPCWLLMQIDRSRVVTLFVDGKIDRQDSDIGEINLDPLNPDSPLKVGYATVSEQPSFFNGAHLPRGATMLFMRNITSMPAMVMSMSTREMWR
eukprot:609713-Rhodomonas_salina.2